MEKIVLKARTFLAIPHYFLENMMIHWSGHQGKVEVPLLNQTENVNHKTVFILYSSFTPEECKFLTEARMSEEWGVSHFVPHCDLCPL